VPHVLNFVFNCLCRVGANWLIRKMASASSPDLDITQDGDKFHLKLHSLVQTKETDFSVNEEFEETQQNGVVMKVIAYYLLRLLVIIKVNCNLHRLTDS